jgi:hypothetical protein
MNREMHNYSIILVYILIKHFICGKAVSDLDHIFVSLCEDRAGYR